MKHIALLKFRAGSQGGLEKYTSRIAHAFTEKGYQISFPQFPLLPVPKFIKLELFDQLTQKWVKEHRPDIVFGMDRNRFQTHYRAGNGVHAAYLKTRSLFCKLNPLHQKILELEKCAFEHPGLQKLFTNSHMVRREILHFYKTDPAKIQVIHNGVEWHEMETDFSNWQTVKPPTNLYHFLFIGHGYRRKGLDPLLLALSQLRQRDFQLTVIGKDKEIDSYRTKTARLGLQNHVHFLGPRQDIRHFYQLADCLVIPSFYDPFANVTVEALAMGLFVISSKTNGGHEILNPSNGTIIEDLHTPDSLIASLETALKKPKTTSSALSIRQSVKALDFSHQLRTLVDACG